MSSFVTFEADSELEKSSQLSTPLSLLSSDHRSIHRKPGWLGAHRRRQDHMDKSLLFSIALVNLTLSGTFLIPTETHLCAL